VRYLAREPRTGFTLHYGEARFSRERATAFYLLVPDGLRSGETRPGILCLSGHGAGVNPLVGLDGIGRPLKEPEYHHEFAAAAARSGFVALAFEQMSFGRRRAFSIPAQHGCHHATMCLLHLGYSLAGLRVAEARGMGKVLSALPQVRGRQIGVAGISGGGQVAIFTAAVERRFRAACVSGYFNTFRTSILSRYHCMDHYLPGLQAVAEMPDIAALVAPRPLLIQSGVKDTDFPIAATRRALAKLRAAYRVAGRPDALEADIFDGPHEFRNAKVWPFFQRALG
jgi:dienelactone hydrolase